MLAAHGAGRAPLRQSNSQQTQPILETALAVPFFWAFAKLFARSGVQRGTRENRDSKNGRVYSDSGAPWIASKHELQRKLNLSRGGGRRRDRPGRGAIGVTRENHLVRVREIGVIENIENLRSELHGPLLTDSEPFEK